MLVRYVDPASKCLSDNLFSFDDVFDELFNGWQTGSSLIKHVISADVGQHGYRHGYRVYADNDGMTLEIDLPGVDPKDVALEFVDNQFVVKYSRNGKKYTKRYAVNNEYDIDTAKATMSHGLLRIHVGRTAAHSTKKIPIKIN
jgi:HSP20 family molecular chaperone IbpA